MDATDDDKLQRDVVSAYRNLARRSGNTKAAFGAALETFERARPGLDEAATRRAVAALLAYAAEDDRVR